MYLTALGAFAFLLSLPFIKAKSAPGTMKPLIYGMRIILILCFCLLLKYYLYLKESRAQNFLGKSLDEINSNHFIGSWYKKTHSFKQDKLITFYNDSTYFEYGDSQSETGSGSWRYDEITGQLYLEHDYNFDSFIVHGRKENIITVSWEGSLGLFSPDFTLIRKIEKKAMHK